jgi:hypothetical protein
MTAVRTPAAQCCAATSIDEPSRQMICKKIDASTLKTARTCAGSIFTVCPAANPGTTIV